MKGLCIGAVLLFSTMSLYAGATEDFSFYGSVRAGTWLDRVERVLDDTLGTYTDTASQQQAVIGKDPAPRFNFNIIPHGNFGFKYKKDRFGATVELGVTTCVTNGFIQGGTTGGFVFAKADRYTASIRLFFAEVFLSDNLTLVVGQNFAPLCFLTSNQKYYNDNSFGNTGNSYSGRKPMLEIIFSNLKNSPAAGLEAKLAAIRVDTASFKHIYFLYPNKNTSCDSKFPKMETSVKAVLSTGSLTADMKAAAGFQQYDIRYSETVWIPDSEKIEPVNSYVIGGNGRITVASAFVQLDFTTGQNFGPYGMYVANPFIMHGQGGTGGDLMTFAYPEYIVDSGKVIKSESKMSQADIILGFKAAPWLSIEGGAGWVHASRDHQEDFNKTWHDTWAGYLQAEFKIMEKLTITPEIGGYYYGPKKYWGRMLYAGFATSVDF